MLKATNSGKYRKPSGQLVYTYTVAGTAKEIAEYKAAQAEATGKAIEQLTLGANGQPLFWFVPNLMQGRIARKTFNLNISFNGRIVIDDTNESIEKDERIASKMEDHTAVLLAEMALGLRSPMAQTTAPVRVTAVVAEEKADNIADDLDNATNELQNNAGAKELVEQGDEDLADQPQ